MATPARRRVSTDNTVPASETRSIGAVNCLLWPSIFLGLMVSRARLRVLFHQSNFSLRGSSLALCLKLPLLTLTSLTVKSLSVTATSHPKDKCVIILRGCSVDCDMLLLLRFSGLCANTVVQDVQDSFAYHKYALLTSFI